MLFKYTFVTLIATFFFISCSSDSSDNLNSEENTSITQEIHELINKYRVSKGKSQLIFSKDASSIALKHTKYMINVKKISHDKFDDRFKELQNLDNAIGAAENVASHQKTANQVVQNWINSNGHRKNIEGNYSHTGIGVEKNSSGNYYFTQLFYSK
ncbi:CAP domain-containing protein [uncultured Tenacibaculum sp.]|uniref:CAP domain-containing protein n=1 Tax=uncultured Tenacibaculum sp. TaxID=174713 RepID=UPI0026179CAC|nr:CAP domain-containing protein [uncultured Tenacibaculum sp.]